VGGQIGHGSKDGSRKAGHFAIGQALFPSVVDRRLSRKERTRPTAELYLAAGSGQFEARNPTLLADKLNIDESKAQEITAFLRPNPMFALSADGTQIAPDKGVWRPFAGTFESPSFSYLHERQHKRELRLESAKKGTLIAESSHADLERTLLFNLRRAFVSMLQAKAVLQLAIRPQLRLIQPKLARADANGVDNADQ
jgi:hypothetical protein